MAAKLKPAQIAAQKALLEREVEEELASKSFPHFVRYMWSVLHPETPLTWGRHMDVVLDAIGRQLSGEKEYQNLLILLPPGFNKSIMASVMRPAWVWLHWPSRSSTYVSCLEDLASRDSRKTRILLQSDRYKRLQARLAVKGRGACPVCGKGEHPLWQFAEDQNVKINFENTMRGSRQCISIESKAIGKRSDDVLFDDVLDAQEVRNATPARLRELLTEVNDQVAYFESTRVNNLRTATRTLIMQPLCEGDPAWVRIREGGWKVIYLPIRFQADSPHRCPEDWRTKDGEWLHAARFSEEEERFNRSKLRDHYETQYEMRWRPKEGAIIKQTWLQRYYSEDAAAIKAIADEVVIAIDSSVKGEESNDPTSMACWAKVGTQKYLVDLVNERMGWLGLKRNARAFIARHPEARIKLVEDKASGSQLCEELKAMGITGVVAHKPGVKSKAVRAKMWAVPALEAGEVLLPRPEFVPWVAGYQSRMASFRENGSDDDDVDTTTMVCRRWEQGATALTLARVQSEPRLRAGSVVRWSQKEPGVRYRMGVWAGFALNANTASWGVVVDGDTGLEVSRVLVSEHGEGAAVVALADEALVWGATVRVAGPVAPRLIRELARRHVKVVREPWLPRQVGEVYGAVERAARDQKVTVRSVELENEAALCEAGELTPAMWALGLAVTGGAEKSVPASAPRLVMLGGRTGTDDAWSRTATFRTNGR